MKTVAQTVIEADHFYTIAAHTGNVIQAVEGTKEAGTSPSAYTQQICHSGFFHIYSHFQMKP